MAEFRKLAQSPNRPALMNAYVQKFATDTARSDFAWVLGYPGGVLPFSLSPSNDAEGKLRRAIQIEMAEAEVRLFLEQPEKRTRYCHLVVWSRVFAPNNLPKRRRDLQKGIRGQDYWYHARNFVVLAELTSRQDLLKDAAPENLAGKATEWDEWLSTEGWRLRFDETACKWKIADSLDRPDDEISQDFQQFGVLSPDIPPRLPFPDWSDEAPIPGLVLNAAWLLVDDPVTKVKKE